MTHQDHNSPTTPLADGSATSRAGRNRAGRVASNGSASRQPSPHSGQTCTAAGCVDGACVPEIDQPAMSVPRLAAFAPHFISAIVLVWEDDGSRVVLTGPQAEPLPGPEPLWVLTASDPDGRELHIEENIVRHADLLNALDEYADGPGVVVDSSDRGRWWPAVGSTACGVHHELSVAVSGLTEERARAIGLRFGQLAIFEVTEDLLRLVPCIPGSGVEERDRRWDLPGDPTLTDAMLRRWRTQTDRSIERARSLQSRLVH